VFLQDPYRLLPPPWCRFKLPGEAQKIDRMMSSFAKQYHKNNPSEFSCEGAHPPHAASIHCCCVQSPLTSFTLSSVPPPHTRILRHPPADTIYILSFSTLMLHTDAHNVDVKDKMTVEGFLRNNSGIDQGSDIDAAVRLFPLQLVGSECCSYVQCSV
jgi:brefeldin A-inhibited guanine nucleotide-exchange protein